MNTCAPLIGCSDNHNLSQVYVSCTERERINTVNPKFSLFLSQSLSIQFFYTFSTILSAKVSQAMNLVMISTFGRLVASVERQRIQWGMRLSRSCSEQGRPKLRIHDSHTLRIADASVVRAIDGDGCVGNGVGVWLWRQREHKLLGLMDMVVYYLHGYTSSHQIL